ncbi:DNRLRE domain-containing protein [Bacillus salacetis]|uniref:DNRLRE domain-containing protein n=1 Tax=Bacillus salacetis TaxID=2315464 RepID=UPI003BA1FDCB
MIKRGLSKKILLSLVAFILLFSSIPLSSVFAHGGSHNQQINKEENKKEEKPKPKKVSFEDSLQQNVKKVEEVKDSRTANGSTFVNSDLSYTTDIHTGAVHYKDSQGKYHPIENKLKKIDEKDKKGFKYKSDKNQFSVEFAEKVKKNSELVSISFGKEKLGFILQNAQREADVELEENNVLYKNVFNDTDIKYSLLPDGLKEDIVLHSKDSQSEFTFDIIGSLIAKQSGKNIEFYNNENKMIWVMTPPFMEDAKEVFSHDIEYTLVESSNKKQSIQLKIDKEFINDPDRAFPILVDPTVNLGGSASNTLDSYVMQDYPSYNYYTSTDLRTGYADSTGVTRSYMDFTNSLPNLNGGLLVKAELKAYRFSNGYNTINTNLYAQRVSSSWGVNTVTWNNQPSIDTTKTYGSTAVNGTLGWATLNITELVDKWYDGTANHGVVLRSTSEGTLGTYRKYNSAEASSNKPYLAVTYSGPPSAPTGTDYGNGTGTSAGYVNLSWTPVSGATGYKVLIFNGKEYQEINVGNITSWSTKGKKLWPTVSQIQQGLYALRLDGTGADLADDPRPVYKNSGGVYPNSKNYWFRVKAYNAYGETVQSGAFMPTLPDQTKPTKPGKPVVTNKLNSNFTFTWGASTDSLSGVKGYRVYVGTGSGKTDVVAGTFVTANTFTITNAIPRTQYFITVVAEDNEGNTFASDETIETARKQLDASIDGVSIPSQMEAGGQYSVQIKVRNEGLETWTAAGGFLLGSVKEVDPLTADTRVQLSSADSIGPSQVKTFTLNFVGNKSPGDYITEWQMLKLQYGSLGEVFSKAVKVVDTTPPTGKVTINNGETLTNSPNVFLKLNAQDNSNPPYSVKLRNELNTWSVYEQLADSDKPWVLSNSNGEKTVSTVFKDQSGNESIIYSDSITLDTSYPTAKLTSPAAMDYVNGVTVIKGTATDNDLKEYTISYGNGEAPTSWTTIKTGTSVVTENILGDWNTASIPAGLYTVRLSVSDQAGNTSISSKMVWVDPLIPMLGTENYWGFEEINTGYGIGKVNLANGNSYLEFSDSNLKGRGLGTEINRIYNSQDETVTPLGKGWRLDLYMSIKEKADGNLLLTDEDGSQHLFVKNADSTYTAPAGIFRKLSKLSDGTFKLVDLDAASIAFTFNVMGQLTSFEDLNGNKIQIRYSNNEISELEDPTGRITSFTYLNNRLEDIITFAGTKVHFSYINGQLAGVEYYDGKGSIYRTIGYKYGVNGKLEEYTNPNNKTVTFQYNGHRLIAVKGTLTTRNAATGQLNNLYPVQESFNYDLLKKTTQVTNHGSNQSLVSIYETNQNGNLIKSIDDPSKLNIVNSFNYEKNQLKESIDGKGYKTSYTYDERGNVLTKTEPLTHDIEGGTHTPLTRFEYKAGTSLISKETDPLGRVIQHDYDSKGNRVWTIDSEGFKESFNYDS